jgi:hypothetical protein
MLLDEVIRDKTSFDFLNVFLKTTITCIQAKKFLFVGHNNGNSEQQCLLKAKK